MHSSNILTQRIVVYSFVLLLLSACGIPDTQKTTKPNLYFDIEDFLLNEAQELSQKPIQLLKTVRIQDDVSTFLDSNPNWDREFEAIRKLNINKAGLKGEYEVDTIRNANQTFIFFENHQNNQPVKSVKVILNNANLVDIIEIIASDKTFFKEETFLYSYQKNKAFNIVGSRKSFFSDAKEFEIYGELISAN